VPNEIDHYTVQRVVDVMSNVEARDLGSVVSGIDQKIAELGPKERSFSDLSSEPRLTYRYWVTVAGKESDLSKRPYEPRTVTKELPVGYQQIASALRAVHPELEDASRIFGATRLRALVDITTPLIRNGVIATWIFIFIGSIRELSATILLFTARTKTISVTMFDLRESNDWGPIAVLSITMLVITFVMIAIIHRFTDARLK